MWDDLGKYRATGFGVEATSWTDVKSYMDINRVAQWEGQLIHAMSKVFVEARNSFADVICEPPYLHGGYSFSQLSAQAADARCRSRKK